MEALESPSKEFWSKAGGGEGNASLVGAGTGTGSTPPKGNETAAAAIERSLYGYLPQGRIELARGDFQRGDQVDITVRFRNGKNGVAGDLYTPKFHVELDDIGWRRSAKSEVIVYRADSGADKDWKTNVAGVVEWGYRYRSPDTDCERLVNALEPGIGLHIASLDMGDTTTEIGLGVNVSIFSGLLSFGTGRNLAEDDPYHFIGGDILGIFEALKGDD